MKKSLRPAVLLPLLLLCVHASLFAQNPSKVSIRGIVQDTSGAEIAFATVMLLSPKDTTLVNFTRSDDKGAFAFKNVKNTPYLLKISYVSYLPFQQYLPASPSEENALGTLKIKQISQELMEVVVRTAKAPLRIHGDTIEYDASTFKVPPGSTVEDLLRRLPGIEVDAAGNIRAQGKDVKRVYVDGKMFFGDDPKSATKNLGAETISKVQVYNEKSEQSKLTGVDDGKKEKAMNLELKEEFKKGSFGKVTAAAGTSERWAGRASYNRFNKKQQLSFLGFGNNINQTGVNWEDYGEFKGQNTFGGFDNGDFGFTSGRRYYMFGEDGPLNYFDGRGFTKNFGSGVNYNFDNKKAKFNVSYFYNEINLNLDQYGFRETFLPENTFSNTDTTLKHDFRGAHNINTRLELELDSNDVLILKASNRFSNNSGSNRQAQLFSESGNTPTNSLNIDNSNALDAWNLTSAVIYRHRFKKKGRSVAASAGYNNSQTDGTENLFSLNQFFKAPTFTEQVRQLNTAASNTQQVKSSLLFTEPLSKRWYWESFYNFNQTDNKVNRQVGDPETNNQRIDSLSVFYDFKTLYNRLGSSIRYSYQGLNATAGFAAQGLQLDGRYAIDENLPLLRAPIHQTFLNWVPNIDANLELPNNMSMGFNYSYSVKEPQLTDLQPIPNVNNPAFRTEGNPDLLPERSHSIDFNYGYWNPSSFANVGIGGTYNLYDNQIIYNQTTEFIDSIGIRTTSRPANVSGSNSANVYLWSSYPIIKTKLTVNLSGDLSLGKAPSFINGVENQTDNHAYSVRMGVNATPNPKLIFDLNGNLRFNDIQYSIQSTQNQKIQNHGIDASVKWQFASKFFFESNFNYSIYRNDRLGFNQNIPIWNASVRRLLGKSNRVELRLAGFDLLNKRVNITQSASQNFVTRNIANTLARYYMLSVSYNVRGYENKLKKNDWW